MHTKGPILKPTKVRKLPHSLRPTVGVFLWTSYYQTRFFSNLEVMNFTTIWCVWVCACVRVRTVLQSTVQVFISVQQGWINKESRFMTLTCLRWSFTNVCVCVCFNLTWCRSVHIVVLVCAVWGITQLLHLCAAWTQGLCAHGLHALLFVQCGRGRGGGSIANKWIQINIEPRSEGGRRDWR